ncbi:MAG: gliding motility lipoprotein GldH [Draconibacterium sp.]|nr:MAG: gliding motility lipoprotein GldH [Draconibacterium sp.]
MRKIMALAAGVWVFAAFIVSCDTNRIFEKNINLPDEGWDKDTAVVFEIPVKDTLQSQNMYINLRNDIRYKYSNLWLFISIVEPGSKILTDTFEIVLADPAGKWLGEGLGGVKDSEVIFKRHIYFPVSGTYEVRFQQGMREDVLTGITNIGLRLEKQE